MNRLKELALNAIAACFALLVFTGAVFGFAFFRAIWEELGPWAALGCAWFGLGVGVCALFVTGAAK